MAARALTYNDVRAEGLPVYSLSRQEKLEELRLLLRFDHGSLIRDNEVCQSMHGLSLSWHYHPHAWGIRCGKMLTPVEVFSSNQLLRDALKRRKRLGKCETRSDLRKALRTYSGTQSVSNFRP